MRDHETAKEFLRNRWALRTARPWTPIQVFQETLGVTTPFNENLPEICRLQPQDVSSAAEGISLSPSAATNQETANG